MRLLISLCCQLVGADLTGLSDPYCKFLIEGQSYKTKVVKKSLNPVSFSLLNFCCIVVSNSHVSPIYFKIMSYLSIFVWLWPQEWNEQFGFVFDKPPQLLV